ncbi:hypothetical protein MTR_0152s0040 [Medicago truncatula]|uniref:Uncharacterized protein n=1 Tax=Medicago truncatula TaxID=3880 RepID=A0A072TH46_MEDTR|nr:hypothetical protein MTR_0152s0040 [Medicago truncatula]
MEIGGRRFQDNHHLKNLFGQLLELPQFHNGEVMENMKKLDEEAWKDMIQLRPSMWTRIPFTAANLNLYLYSLKSPVSFLVLPTAHAHYPLREKEKTLHYT